MTLAHESLHLIGKYVRVSYGEAGYTVIRGRLLSIDEFGECAVVDDEGIMHYCWPLLNIELWIRGVSGP